MKRLILILVWYFWGNSVKAQSTDWAIGINKWYSQPDGINWLLQHYRPIYDFRAREKIASIGAGQGIREVVFSLMADSLTFYLQDINPYWIEPDRLTLLVQRIYRQAGRSASTATFISVRGREQETKLPRQFFDKIIVENSLHEFSFQADMLVSIRQCLKPTGQLFIWEAVTKKPNKKHQDCGKPMFTDESLIKLVTENGFRFVNKTVVDPPRGKDAVFKFNVEELAAVEKIPSKE